MSDDDGEEEEDEEIQLPNFVSLGFFPAVMEELDVIEATGTPNTTVIVDAFLLFLRTRVVIF